MDSMELVISSMLSPGVGDLC